MNTQICALASAISWQNMEAIALKYMDITGAKIENTSSANRENLEACTRKILRIWSNKNPGNDQVVVSRYLLSLPNKSSLDSTVSELHICTLILFEDLIVNCILAYLISIYPESF